MVICTADSLPGLSVAPLYSVGCQDINRDTLMKMLNIYEKNFTETPNYGNKNLSVGLRDKCENADEAVYCRCLW